MSWGSALCILQYTEVSALFLCVLSKGIVEVPFGGYALVIRSWCCNCLDVLRGWEMSRRNEYDLICIGSGPAGQRAAIQAAKLGKKAVVIEKQQCIGGVCIETGTIPSKTFREAVRYLYAQPHLDGTDPDGYAFQV